MAKENPILQVLPTLGNQAMLTAGNRVTDLHNGQLGIFNYHTGLSVDGTALANCKDIFIALGIAKAGGTAIADDIRKSAGQMIQTSRQNALTAKGYVPEIEKVIEITNFIAKCETEYAIKLTFTNQRIYRLNGYTQFTKTFNYTTGCCAPTTDCTDCSNSGDCVELAVGLVTNVNADADSIVTASLFGNKIVAVINGAPTSDANTVVTVGTTSYTVAVLDADTTAQAAAKIVAVINTQTGSPYYATLSGSTISIYVKATKQANTDTFAVTGAGVTANGIVASTKTVVTDTDGFKAAYPGVCLGIRLTGVAEDRPAWNGDLNIKYAKTGTNFSATLIQGFTCTGTVTEITPLQYAEGSGYDLKYEEYFSGGTDGRPGPYRVSALTNTSRSGFQYLISESSNYTVVTINGGMRSQSGFLEYDASLRTIIAVPCADTVTLQGLFTMFDLIFTQFAANSTPIALVDCTNTQTVADAVNAVLAY